MAASGCYFDREDKREYVGLYAKIIYPILN